MSNSLLLSYQCVKYAAEHPCRSVISNHTSARMFSCKLLRIFRTPFPENTYRRLLLNNRFPLITDNIVTNVWALLFPIKELYTAQAGILLKLCESVLTPWRPMFPSYRNQSVDLLCKSADWFLYDGNIGRQRVLRIIVLHHCKVTWEILVSIIFPL